MSIKDVSQYFTNRIKEVDPSFRPHADGFNIDNVGASKFDRTYHILPLDMACSALSNLTTTDTLTVEIHLMFKGFRDPSQCLIDAYDVANAIRLKAMGPKTAMVGESIKNIVCTSLKPEPANGNDNAIKMRCNFQVTLVYGVDD